MTSPAIKKPVSRPAGEARSRTPLAALYAVDDRFRVIFDAVIDGIFLTDPGTGKVLEANAAGCAMFGYTKAEIIGLEIGALSSGVHPYTQEQAVATSTEAPMGDARMIEWQCRKKDGALFWAELSKHYTRIGRMPVNISSMRDISERKRVDRRLRIALADAAAANEAKSAFLANMSHELRTPLNAVIGFSDLMLSQTEALISRHREYLQDIRASGLHLLALINDVLDLSRLEAHALTLEQREVSLRHVIADACRMVKAQARKARLHICLEVDADLPPVMGDSRRLRQIFLNLLSNALKFTESPGTITIRIRIEGNNVCCEVHDTGIGIAQDDLAKVTERFGQVENKFSRTHQGAGLGLPLVKELVELHGGALSIASTLGKGTSVTVCLAIGMRQRNVLSAAE